MEEKDFKIFQKWSPHLFYKVEQYSAGILRLSPSFKKAFPLLSDLIGKARVLDIRLKEHSYQLLSWSEKGSQEENMWWLCETNISDKPLLPFLDEHNILIDNLGGIAASFYLNIPKPLNANQNFMFIPNYCTLGLDERGGLEYYKNVCAEHDCQPIQTQHLLKFAHEAGGALSFCDPANATVLLYANDHDFNYVTVLPGQPEYTFYTINGVRTFTDYVETLAKQWLEWVV